MEAFAQIVAKSSSNRQCFDCNEAVNAHPWISVQHGIVLCIKCAGIHRSLGVDVSFVRSLKLDYVAPKDLEPLAKGGNDAFAAYLDSKVSGGLTRQTFASTPVARRYFCPAAELYRRRLASLTAGEDPPTDLRTVALPASFKDPPVKEKCVETWTPNTKRCNVCSKSFSIIRRRHHCRKCGNCVCDTCSPRECYRPLPPVTKPVRHCTACVRPPSIVRCERT